MRHPLTSSSRTGALSSPGSLYALIHPSAWKGSSANFALTGFSEVLYSRGPTPMSGAG